jgi:hypothetical protein
MRGDGPNSVNVYKFFLVTAFIAHKGTMPANLTGQLGSGYKWTARATRLAIVAVIQLRLCWARCVQIHIAFQASRCCSNQVAAVQIGA